jgi:hypothetical protein
MILKIIIRINTKAGLPFEPPRAPRTAKDRIFESGIKLNLIWGSLGELGAFGG